MKPISGNTHLTEGFNIIYKHLTRIEVSLMIELEIGIC